MYNNRMENPVYISSPETEARRVKAYGYLKTMMQLKEKNMPHFSAAGRMGLVT